MDYVDFNATDEFNDFVHDLIDNKTFNFTSFIPMVICLSKENNITLSDIMEALDNVTDGCLSNTSKLIQKIADLNLNITNITAKFKEFLDAVGLEFNKISTGLSDFIKSIDLNMSKVSDGWEKILNVVDFNSSAIKEAFDKIYQEINFNVSSIMDGINKIRDSFSFNISAIKAGLDKIADSFTFNASSLVAGKDKIVNAFKFDLASIIGNASKIINSFSYDSSSFLNGINRIINGLGINTSNIVNNLFTKLGKGAVLALILIPDDYIIPISFKMPTKIDASKVTTTYGKGKEIIITLKDISTQLIAGKQVTVTLNGKTYTGVTNAKGQVSITVPNNLVPKTYKAVITFEGDSTYGKSTKTVEFIQSQKI